MTAPAPSGTDTETTVMIEILVVVGFLTLVAVAALFGTDSRDGRDWQPRDGSWGEHGSPHH